MSHVATVKASIKDLDALEKAADIVGGVFKRDQRTFLMYGNRREPCVHAITIKGAAKDAYEVGLRHATTASAGGAAEPEFEFACDFFDHRIGQAFGQNLEKLRNEYLAVVAEDQLMRGGWRVEREQVGQQVVLRAYA